MRHKILTRALARVLALTLALAPSWAITYTPATWYFDTAGNGGSLLNGGGTDTATPLFGCPSSCTTNFASWTSAQGGTATASASWTLGATTFNISACTNAFVGGGVWDTTLSSQGMIGVVLSCTGTGPFVLTLTGPAIHASSGASDGLQFGAPITLNGSPDIHATPGCTLQSGTTYLCDGSQRLYLNNSSGTKRWPIVGFTSCSGSGACVVAVGANAISGNPGCATCTGSTSGWAIGGRVTMPISDGNAVLPGDTIIINNSIACGAALCYGPGNTGGDVVTGLITIKPAAGAVTLSNTGNFNVIQLSSFTWMKGPITLNNAAASTGFLLSISAASNSWVDGLTFTEGAGATGHCLNGAAGTLFVTNNTFTNCGGDAINLSAAGDTVVGNNITGTIGGNGINLTPANNYGIVSGNIINGVGNQGILIAGISLEEVISGNTIANSQKGGIVFTAASSANPIKMFNNILYNNNLGGTGTYYNISLTAGVPLPFHNCNDFFVAAGNNFNNFTPNPGDITTDPLFVNGAPGSANLNLQPGSPARVGCYQTPGGYATNNVAMGALQPAASGGGGGTVNVGIIGGGL